MQAYQNGEGPQPFRAPVTEEGYAYSLCFDGEFVYMSGAHTDSLRIVNLDTGESFFVANWHLAEMPPGYVIHNKETGEDTDFTEFPEEGLYSYRNVAENYLFHEPSITGLAFDGENMFAICGITDALYKVGRR